MSRLLPCLILLLCTAAACAAPPPLIAHWTFDEDTGAVQDASGNGYHASADSSPGLTRVAGLFGNAMSFSGRHRLHVQGKPDFSKVKAIALSAWVRPTKFERYNEIFRKEDGNHRVLFSFQENMSVLSLGLNVGGYVECDARIAKEQVLDGTWHHCAATFDGKTMRVYLDGREVGALKRQGSIDAQGGADGCIGSTNGGECFQGCMDDLRIYGGALSAQDIDALYKEGVKELGRIATALGKKLDAFYVEKNSFAATLAATRKKLYEERLPIPAGLGAVVLQKLRARFPKESGDFIQWTGMTPLQ